MRNLILLIALSLGAVAQVAAPSLTELERERLGRLASQRENLELKAAAIREAQAKLDAEIGAFLEGLKAKYPGYELGANGTLVKVPPTPPAGK